MENSNMKKMVVLKNLPSNIVEEAIIVLKSNKKVKNLQKIENKKICDEKEIKKDKDYIIKEAEMLVNSYVSKIENKNNINFKNYKKQFLKLKKYACIISLFSFIELIALLVK